MSEEFTPITTQEEFDARLQECLSERIRRAEEKGEEKALKRYADYDSIKGDLEKAKEKISSYEKTIAGHEAKISQYEKKALRDKVAREKGLPWEMSSYIQGETEEELAKSADVLAKFKGSKEEISPLADLEEKKGSGDRKDTALINLWEKLKGER